MINIILLSLILIGLILHFYLSIYLERGTLPYERGFQAMAILFALLYFINFVRMFGFTVGLILGFLCNFQIIFNFFLWFFLWRTILYDAVIKKHIGTPLDIERLPSMTVTATWNLVVLIILVLTIINFFYSDFEQLKPLLNILYNFDNSLIYLLIFIALSWTIRALAVINFTKKFK